MSQEEIKNDGEKQNKNEKGMSRRDMLAFATVPLATAFDGTLAGAALQPPEELTKEEIYGLNPDQREERIREFYEESIAFYRQAQLYFEAMKEREQELMRTAETVRQVQESDCYKSCVGQVSLKSKV